MSLRKFHSFSGRQSASSPIIPGKGRRRSRRRFAPDLLSLETRALLSTLVVTNDNDSGTGSLRAELGLAVAGDTITFSPKAYGTITLTGGPLAVTTSVNIQGPGASKVTVSGDDKSTVFDIESGVTASISGLTITDGVASIADSYGFISGGGGIYSTGDLTLGDCVVTGNSASAADYRDGGGIWSNAAPYEDGTLTITGCTITGNSAYTGGGIQTGGPLTIAGSTISGNSANSAGAIQDFVSNASLTDSVVSGNTGGGIVINGLGAAAVPTLTVTDSTIEGNSSAGFGGGIESDFANVTVSGSLIASNISTNYPGGGLALGGGIDMSGDLSAETPGANILTVAGTTFVGNQADCSSGSSGGGAIYADSYATIFVKNSSFIGNIASSPDDPQGGAMQFDTLTQGTIANCVFTGNKAVQSPSPYGGGNALGGAIDNEDEFGAGGALTISGSTFTNNLAQADVGQGGAIFNGFGTTTLNLSSSLLVGNHAVSIGGATASDPYAGFATGGGLADSFGATATVTDSSFLDNSASGGNDPYAGGSAGFAWGGAIDDDGLTLTIIGGTIAGNSAIGGSAAAGSTAGNAGGGGIHVGPSTLKVDGATIVGNSAIGGAGGGDGEGGGVAVSGSGANASFTDVLISLNAAIGGSGGGSGYGGGLYIGTGALTTLTNTKVVANFASTAGDNIYGTDTDG